MLNALLLLAAALHPQAANPAPADAPHVVLILTDDQRADTIAAWGNPSIRTPNLDGLTERGTSFHRAYCMGSSGGAVCVPSRAMIHSGKPYFGMNLGTFDGAETVGGALAKAGYQTFHTGKWHNGKGSFARSFQSGRRVMFSGMSHHRRVPCTDFAGGEFSEVEHPEGHSSELFAEAAVAFIEERAEAEDSGTPFFLSVAFSAPHDPRDPPRPYARPYYEDPPPLPRNFMPQHPFDNGFLVLRDENLAPWPRTREVVQDQLAEYYGLIEHLDAQIGRVLAALDGLEDNREVLLIYLADHGLAVGSHGLLGKQSVYEHSLRAPLIVSGPGFPAGQSTTALTYLTDVYGTMLTAAGASFDRDARFCRDLGPAARGEDPAPREAITLSMGKTQRAITDGRWKLARYPHVDHTQLFDLASDPHELVDLSDRPDLAGRRAAMLREMEALLLAAGDKAQLTVETPSPLTRDLTGTERGPDRWQPRWIREKYFDEER